MTGINLNEAIAAWLPIVVVVAQRESKAGVPAPGTTTGSHIQQCLAESFETAQKIADGTTRVAFTDDANKPELLFSAEYTCPHCGYSLNELDPRT